MGIRGCSDAKPPPPRSTITKYAPTLHRNSAGRTAWPSRSRARRLYELLDGLAVRASKDEPTAPLSHGLPAPLSPEARYLGFGGLPAAQRADPPLGGVPGHVVVVGDGRHTAGLLVDTLQQPNKALLAYLTPRKQPFALGGEAIHHQERLAQLIER